MRYFRHLLVCFVIISAACTKNSDARDVAEKFLTAISNNRYDEARQYCTIRTHRYLTISESLSRLKEEKHQRCDYEIIECSVDGNSAQVAYRRKGQPDVETLSLVKNGKEWLVGSGR